MAMLPKALQRTQTTPINVPRSRRSHVIRGLTSLPAGKMVPIHVIPLLREDQIESCALRINAEMLETVEVLMNPVHLNVKAYLVSHVAHPRFSGMDELNRSMAGIPNQEGGAVTPFFTVANGPAKGANLINEYLGKHVKPGVPHNAIYTEVYNLIWNFRAKNRSPDIAERTIGDGTLAHAFWQHEQFAHIVPTFDQAIIDGEVPLNVVNGLMPVKGGPIKLQSATKSGNMTLNTAGSLVIPGAGPAASEAVSLQDISNLVAELNENGITVSLSNIELARKTQAFARLRMQFAGHDDEYIIDMLMNGLTITEQAFKQPILLAEQSTVFGMSKRYASDAENLTESVVNGMTFIDMNIRCPRVPMGGVIMIVAEVTPEQLFERQKDPYQYLTSPEQMPEYLRDTLDPEKVEAVTNDEIDMVHTVPAGTFGYAPLHSKWNFQTPCIGGKFFRPEVNTEFDEERQRIWAVETVDPILSEDFYLCKNMHTKPFVMTNVDPFEVVTRGAAVISGNTVFGLPLIEAHGQYDEVMEEAPTDRLEGVPAPAATKPAPKAANE